MARFQTTSTFPKNTKAMKHQSQPYVLAGISLLTLFLHVFQVQMFKDDMRHLGRTLGLSE